MAAFILVDMKSPDQYVGFQRFGTNWWCVFCEIQLFLQILEDLLKVSTGDLHIAEVPLRLSQMVILSSRAHFPGAS